MRKDCNTQALHLRSKWCTLREVIGRSIEDLMLKINNILETAHECRSGDQGGVVQGFRENECYANDTDSAVACD